MHWWVCWASHWRTWGGWICQERKLGHLSSVWLGWDTWFNLVLSPPAALILWFIDCELWTGWSPWDWACEPLFILIIWIEFSEVEDRSILRFWLKIDPLSSRAPIPPTLVYPGWAYRPYMSFSSVIFVRDIWFWGLSIGSFDFAFIQGIPLDLIQPQLHFYRGLMIILTDQSVHRSNHLIGSLLATHVSQEGKRSAAAEGWRACDHMHVSRTHIVTSILILYLYLCFYPYVNLDVFTYRCICLLI